MEFYIGHVFLVPSSSVPDGTLPCDGRSLTISGNEPLFSLLGTRFGGDGQSSFKIPDLRTITPPGLIYTIVVDGIYPINPS